MKKTDLKEVQLAFNDEGEIVEDTHKDSLETEKVEYEKLDKVDLVRLCKEKDTCLQSYETERGNMTDAFNNEINNMNEYYTKRIKELKSLPDVGPKDLVFCLYLFCAIFSSVL